MRNEIIETGKTVEEAIIAACEKLGCEREDCEWEIIDLPKKGGFLGLKNIPAKVRVSCGADQAEPAPVPVQTMPKAQIAPSQPLARDEDIAVKEQQKYPQDSRPIPQENAFKKPEPRRQQPTSQQYETPKPAAPTAPAEKTSDRESPVSSSIQVTPTDEMTAKAQLAKQYLEQVLAQLELSPKFSLQWEENGVCISIRGEGLGVIIGRRGETLDALQYLAGLVANRIDGSYLRVTVDCGDYRIKRRATLEALARKLSAQVLKTDVSKTLEPMNPFERRIIHATVSTIEGVSSTSVGEEPNRRVVITSPTARPIRRPYGRYNDGYSTGGNRSGGDRRPPRDARARDNNRPDRRGGSSRRDNNRPRPAVAQPTTPPANPPTEAVGKPLYTKLDLE